MKKLILALMLCLSNLAIASTPINQLVFFGDSLSDDGNLYRMFFKVVPKSPPYYNGRFSNGPTWSEYLGKYYYDKYYIPYRVYALGGATAVFHPPSTKFITTSTLDLEINYYLLDSIFKNRSKALYSIWIGGNDYVFDFNSNPEKLTTDVVNKISWSIKTLMKYGAKYFLVLNMPDLSRIPYSRFIHNEQRTKLLTTLHNEKLLRLVQTLRKKHPHIKIVYGDLYSMFNEFLTDPTDFNVKWGTHFTNTLDSCWGGGYLLRGFSPVQIDDQIKQSLIQNYGGVPKDVDTEVMRQTITASPSINETFEVGAAYASGLRPCQHPDSYVFWDQIHPTEMVNQVIGKIIVNQLNDELKL